ncbi:conserved Plasmodium protein, unknown function [Plasmodium knowlesi strain H]|uniref:Metallo-beta-lactamase domain-containing protein n=3 Tax=Plasmodium knowlesi TaxID=5850 RepID=A0A5K1U4R8_PLAKH|nr:uncharacterized protein PKNH_1457100 [Plasmodium knowlesi strain H]OTN63644.1 Uncharacterized protein PKNOH_S140275600 [Plasmodium knowlesi]CAA9991168.1 hydrolase, putative [Plasmodium knowlesi strain H]SBO27140.1 conserved Plasmodium protein, unknown function [Plasmodium knowlesi strain H]SBO29375.1 conserved Plasmodium protein, unknown function [Plasmodium knowlesi strain H]VVS80642.1 hydrolase, putative [Plasmodium knowlesi strain H]|eukprot:XP_002262460.1 [Plasmodium knowlesi strain H]
MITGNGIIFLGTGSSSSTPKLSHIFKNSKVLSNRNKGEPQSSELRQEDIEHIDKFVDELVEHDIECIDQLNDLYLRKRYPDCDGLKCYTCYDALNGDSKNKRNNISVLVKSNDSYVLIDVGKTFRDSLLRNKDKINFYEIKLDSVLISHSHTDALNGIDDLRDLQEYNKITIGDSYYYTPKNPIDIYLNSVSYERLRNGYEYLVKKRKENIFSSKIAALNLLVIKDEKYNKLILEEKTANQIKDGTAVMPKEDHKGTTNSTQRNPINGGNKIKKSGGYDDDKGGQKETLLNNDGDDGKDYDDDGDDNNNNDDDDGTCVNIHTYNKKDEYGYVYTEFDKNKRIRFIPFQHGRNYVCVGYIIGDNEKLVYISDCSYIPPSLLEYIKKIGSTEVLIIDALYYKAKHYSHFSLHESIKIALLIKPKKVYFIGMSCDIEHYITNLFLKKLSNKYPDISFSLAHDGLFVPINF